MGSDDAVCRTCQKTWRWHEDNKPVHPFNFGQVGATAFLKRKGARKDADGPKTSPRPAQPVQMGFGNDPVLRIALINRGILTPADLAVAEEQLRQALVAVQEGQGDGEGEVQVGEAAPVPMGGSPESGPEVGTRPGHDQS